MFKFIAVFLNLNLLFWAFGCLWCLPNFHCPFNFSLFSIFCYFGSYRKWIHSRKDPQWILGLENICLVCSHFFVVFYQNFDMGRKNSNDYRNGRSKCIFSCSVANLNIFQLEATELWFYWNLWQNFNAKFKVRWSYFVYQTSLLIGHSHGKKLPWPKEFIGTYVSGSFQYY